MTILNHLTPYTQIYDVTPLTFPTFIQATRSVFTFKLRVGHEQQNIIFQQVTISFDSDSICRVFNTVNVGARGITWRKGLKAKQMLSVIFGNWFFISQEMRCVMKTQQ
jgi:hypothetical protein